MDQLNQYGFYTQQVINEVRREVHVDGDVDVELRTDATGTEVIRLTFQHPHEALRFAGELEGHGQVLQSGASYVVALTAKIARGLVNPSKQTLFDKAVAELRGPAAQSAEKVAKVAKEGKLGKKKEAKAAKPFKAAQKLRPEMIAVVTKVIGALEGTVEFSLRKNDKGERLVEMHFSSPYDAQRAHDVVMPSNPGSPRRVGNEWRVAAGVNAFKRLADSPKKGEKLFDKVVKALRK